MCYCRPNIRTPVCPDCLEFLADKVKKLEIKLSAANEKLLFLDCLERAGVDNWDGYEEALEMFGEGNQ